MNQAKRTIGLMRMVFGKEAADQLKAEIEAEVGSLDIFDVTEPQLKNKSTSENNHELPDGFEAPETWNANDLFYGFVRAYEEPEWPVDKLQFESAGPFAPAMKQYLDSVEPLVGIMAAHLGDYVQKEDDARQFFAAQGVLQILCFEKFAFSKGHRWDFLDLSALRQLRVAWLDDSYRTRPSDVLGWSAYDDQSEAFDLLNGWAISEKLDGLIDSLQNEYPGTPVAELFYSGQAKLVLSVAQLIGVPVSSVYKWGENYEWLNEQLLIPSNQEFIKPDTPEGAVDAFAFSLKEDITFTMNSVEEIFRDIDGSDAWKNRALVASVALDALEPPYSREDLDVLDHILKESIDKFRDLGKENPFSYLYSDPRKPAFDTLFPDRENIKEVVEKVPNVAQQITKDINNPDVALDLINSLMWLSWSIAARSHYVSHQQSKRIQNNWNELSGAYIEILKRQLVQNQKLQSGSFLEDIDALVGLSEIKLKLRQLYSMVQNNQTGRKPKLQHTIFSGNPGTGKTTVARYLGQVYSALGLLPSGHVHYVTRADLVAPYVGQTAGKVKEAIEKARGGILFIDEAYSLKRSGENSSNDFGQEAIDSLLTYMEDLKGELVIVAAGYPAEMETFINSNPGLKSRFSETWNLKDYSADELFEILVSMAKANGVTISQDVEKPFKELAGKARTQKNFSNARWVRNLLDQAILSHDSKNLIDDNSKLTIDDFDVDKKTILPKDLDIDSILLPIDNLIGLESVKEDLQDLVALQQLRVRRREQGLPDVSGVAGHLVFGGPPGTGKNTVARLLGSIYQSLGLLKSGHLVEVQRNDLVAGFIGQTAIKTEAVFAKARGGILFIDEAYTLNQVRTEGAAQDFGQEAIDTLLKLMEDYRDEVVVIAAGYQENMDKFLLANPGLKSRFSRTLKFEKWNEEDFSLGLESELNEMKLQLDDDAQHGIAGIISKIVSGESFASGRTARSFCEAIAVSQARRIAKDPKANLSNVTLSDLESAYLRLKQNL